MVLKNAYDTIAVSSAPEALSQLAAGAADVVLLDIVMPGIDGLQVLEEIRGRHPTLPVVMLTATSTVKTAVDAMKLGAFDYLTKPFDVDELRVVLDKATENAALVREVETLRTEVGRRYQIDNMVGRSPAMQDVFRTVLTVGPLKTTVLITGESGTGQGAHRQGHPLCEPARPQAAGGAQLRGHSRDAARERTLRARARLLHRRACEEAGAVRARAREHALPRRGRRDGRGDAGEAPPCPRAGRVPARRRPAAGAGRRAHHRRHQPRPRGGDARRLLPARPLLPAERRVGAPAPAACPSRRPGAARPAFREAEDARRWASPRSRSARRRSTPCCATRGRGTSASWRT